MRKFVPLFLLLLLCFPIVSLAHPGRTDEKGGHDSPNGYHYHHGYPAHQHYHSICPYDVAEIAYDTAYPWEYQPFLDEYVDGFDCGYDIGAWNGEDDGYSDYHNGTDSFNPWTEYEDNDYPQESPYAYGYCDGYRFGYCIKFEESYNDEASYDDEDYEKYYDPEIEEVWYYAYHGTAPTETNQNIQTEKSEKETHGMSDRVFTTIQYGFLALNIAICIYGFVNLIKNR